MYTTLNFSKKFTYEEVEERWYELLYVEEINQAAKRRMDAISIEKSMQIQSKIPLSEEEERLLCTIQSNSNASTSIFETLLEQNRPLFHFARTAKILEDAWRERKFYGLLVDQKQNSFDDNLLQVNFWV